MSDVMRIDSSVNSEQAILNCQVLSCGRTALVLKIESVTTLLLF